MPLFNNVLLFQDEQTGLKVSLDLLTGSCVVTDGQTMAISGKFVKARTKELLKRLEEPAKKKK